MRAWTGMRLSSLRIRTDKYPFKVDSNREFYQLFIMKTRIHAVTLPYRITLADGNPW